MPTYEYQCGNCGFRCERVHKMTEEPLNKCPKCGSIMRRLIAGGSGVIYKGKGFYKTDYGGGQGSSWGQIKPYRTDLKNEK